MTFSLVDHIILRSACINPESEEIEQTNSLLQQVEEPGHLIDQLIKRGLAPIFLKNLSLMSANTILPAKEISKLNQAYYHTLARNMHIIDSFVEMMNQFNQKNIGIIALKGIHLSDWLYGDIGLRQMSDIDLLIKPTDADACMEILNNSGYVPESGIADDVDTKHEVVHYTPMVRKGVAVELHIKLHQQIESYHIDVEALWENANEVTIHGVKVLCMDNEHLLIHLCIHLDYHFRGGGIQFNGYSDIVNLLRKTGIHFQWEKFMELCNRYKCSQAVLPHLYGAHQYMLAPVPAHIIEKCIDLNIKLYETILIQYLHGFKGFKSGMPKHLSNLRHLQRKSDQIRYLFSILFPDKNFMISKFRIKHEVLYPLYYPYRFWLGLKGLFQFTMQHIMGQR